MSRRPLSSWDSRDVAPEAYFDRIFAYWGIVRLRCAGAEAKPFKDAEAAAARAADAFR